MLSWLNQLFDELGHIQEIPKLAVSLVATTALVVWFLAGHLSKTQISNLQSEVALLKSQLETVDGPLGPLPSYSLGGSDILIYAIPNWTTQDTAKRVELDWNRLANIEAYAVLLMRTEGESESTWVQGRIVNITNREVVATTERHRGGKISARFQLPRASKYPPAKPGALVVSRSKRHDVTATRSLAPPKGGYSSNRSCSSRRSSRSCCWTYSRTTRSSCPTVET